MSEEEQEKLYELLFKDTKNKLEKTIKEQQEKIKELENADLTTVYMNGFYDGEKKWKDKIREKIEDLKQVMEQDEVDDFGIHSIGWGALDYVVEQLKELLEEK